DKKILEKYFENMEQYVEYLKYNSENFIRPNYGYGDWLAINADTPNELIGTAFFAHVSELMSEISKVLGKKNHQKKYIGLSEKIKKAFNKKFVLKNGEILSGTQTSYLLALSFNLLSKEKQKKAFNFLIKDIIKRDYHFSTGFIGLQFLLPILSKFGRDDIAYRLLLDIRFPSWGFMIQNGATTMWERWESYSPQKGIYDPLMNSFNHTSLGVIGEWIYSHNGGINLEKEGFKKINIKPKIGGGLTFARTSYNSIGGKIISNWKIENQNFFLEIEIPINTKAKVFIPSNNLKNIFENNEPISKSKIIKYAGKEKRFFIFEVQSGRYRFSSIIPS
ncbi:MAG: alpha-L-rhamnosidase C-terminal domain-containing protein, partial [Ignavibacteriaceae bacterium]